MKKVRFLVILTVIAILMTLLAVPALPTRGREVAAALLSAAQGDPLTLEVADTNHPAMGLYRSLGFAPAAVVETWWDIT